MRRRMYFLLPDVRRARGVFKQLLLARIDDRHVHVIAKDGTDLGDLPEATLLQKSDVLHGAGLGLIIGGATGAAAGVAVMLFPPSGLVMGLGVILAMSLLGATMGVWAAGMIGSSTPSTHLEAFSDEIAHGKVLMIVDVPRDRVDEISRTIRKSHPEADMRGTDPVPVPFP
ncbi:MAG: DUF1269 domain-containing protein [Gammaproteobacteria bacterium]|nr:DUF1269 domain-containing protein [Gammaproteobacteria bacterium]